MHDIRPKLAQQVDENPMSSKIPPWPNRPAHLIDDDHSIPVAFRFIQQRAFRPDRRTGDQRHVMSKLVLAPAGQQRVFLRPPTISRVMMWTIFIESVAGCRASGGAGCGMHARGDDDQYLKPNFTRDCKRFE